MYISIWKEYLLLDRVVYRSFGCEFVYFRFSILGVEDLEYE